MPGLGLGHGMGMGVGRSVSLFNRVHSELFGSGEQGIYMPSVHGSFLRGDLFQDAAGTTPVTAAGQSVGLWLDRSKGLVLGPELVTNGNFSDGTAGWSNVNFTVVNGAMQISLAGTVGVNDGLVEAGKTYEFMFDVIARTSGTIRLRIGFSGTMQYPGIQSSAVGKFRGIAKINEGLTDYKIVIDTSGAFTGTIDNISVRELPGNHASQPTAAARPTLQQDANGMYVLRFDGVNDFMVTPSVDFTGTDKMTVLAGVQKLRETSRAFVVDTANGGQNAFYLSAPNHENGSQSYGFGAGASSVTVVTMAGYPAPDRAVLSGTGDIATSGAGLALRRNGELGGAAVATGPGVYGNHPLTLGSRLSGGHFQSDIYGLIVCGAQKTLAQIERAENLINRYTRAY